MNDSVVRLAGLMSYANAYLYIAIFVTLIALFTLGGIWGPINDSISVFWALTFLPLLILLHKINQSASAPISLGSSIVGAAAMIGFAFLQSLLVLKVVRFEQTFLAVVTLGGILGSAFVTHSLIARRSAFLPSKLTWLMFVFGLGYILSAVGIWIGGQQHPLAAIGYLSSVLTGPIWAIWLGRVLLKGEIAFASLA